MMLMLTAIIRQSNLIPAGIMIIGGVLGGWLTIHPRQLLATFALNEMDEWSQLIVQIFGQVLLGLTIAPIILRISQWIYF